MAYVYVICAADGLPVKVGKARDPQKRLAEIQWCSPLELYLYGAERFTTEEHALRVEAWVHGHFAQRRSHGEWLKLNPEVALRAVIHAAQELGLPHLAWVPGQEPGEQWSAQWRFKSKVVRGSRKPPPAKRLRTARVFSIAEHAAAAVAGRPGAAPHIESGTERERERYKKH